MEKLDFTLHLKEDFSKGIPYVEMQAGKGKKADSSVYILSEEFTYIEGVIWDKHREYGMSRKSKINTSDWARIMGGFNDAIVEIEGCTTDNDLIEVLKLRNHLDETHLELVFQHKSLLIQLFHDLIEWLKAHIHTEKYILINKNI